MPDLNAILSFYRTNAVASGAGMSDRGFGLERGVGTAPGAIVGPNMPGRFGEAAIALERVAYSFLRRDEGHGWEQLTERARKARLRMGRQRFRRWEIANPDISAVLRRKARAAVA